MSDDDYHTGGQKIPLARLIQFRKEYIVFSNIEKEHHHLMVRYEQIKHVEHIPANGNYMGRIEVYIQNPAYLKDQTNPVTIPEYIFITFRGGECSLGKFESALENWNKAARGYNYNIDTHTCGRLV